jgi:[ribosomal protein S5]-alanine N-acetyltransferase
MQLQTKRTMLREVTLADVNKIHELHCLPETDKYNTMGIPESVEVTARHVSGWAMQRDELPRTKYVLCIEHVSHGFLGLIGMNMGKPAYRNAEIWYKLHPDFWNRGYATEAVNAVLDFGFRDLKLHRIEAGCATENLASRRVLEKVGMIREGHRRQLLPIRGAWVDNFEYAIVESDYEVSRQIPRQ